MRFLRKLRTQIDLNDKVIYGLSQIKGVGMKFAQTVVEVASINPELRVRDLSDTDLNRIQEIIMNPVKNGIPNWMINRQKDFLTGVDFHHTGNKLEIFVNRDIDRMRKIKRYKSMRHPQRLKVRGQRTHSARKPISKRKIRNLIRKIRSLMKTRNSSEIVMERKYLPEFVNNEFLDLTSIYTIKDSIIKLLEEEGIKIQYKENFIKFFIYNDSS